MIRFGMVAGLGTALLWAAALPAAGQPPGGRNDRDGPRPAQTDRSRGYWGFPDWDSRAGSYDRSRRQDDRDGDNNQPGDNRRPDDRRGGPPDRGAGPFGGPPGMRSGATPAGPDDRRDGPG